MLQSSHYRDIDDICPFVVVIVATNRVTTATTLENVSTQTKTVRCAPAVVVFRARQSGAGARDASACDVSLRRVVIPTKDPDTRTVVAGTRIYKAECGCTGREDD